MDVDPKDSPAEGSQNNAHCALGLAVLECVDAVPNGHFLPHFMSFSAPLHVVFSSNEEKPNAFFFFRVSFLALQRLDLAKQLFVDYISQHPDPEIRSKCYNFRILALISALLSLCAKGYAKIIRPSAAILHHDAKSIAVACRQSATKEEFTQIQAALCEVYTKNPRVEKVKGRNEEPSGPIGKSLMKTFYCPVMLSHFSPAPVKTDRAVRIQ